MANLIYLGNKKSLKKIQWKFFKLKKKLDQKQKAKPKNSSLGTDERLCELEDRTF